MANAYFYNILESGSHLMIETIADYKIFEFSGSLKVGQVAKVDPHFKNLAKIGPESLIFLLTICLRSLDMLRHYIYSPERPLGLIFSVLKDNWDLCLLS